MKKTIIILLSVVLFSYCSDNDVPFQYTIRATVTDSVTGDTLKGNGVEVFLEDGQNLNLTANGFYEITVTEAKTYTVKAKANGYKDNKEYVKIEENKINPVNIQLKPLP
jgi:hypothetical protein